MSLTEFMTEKEDTDMPSYCVNTRAQSNGDHEVHDVTAGKSCLPDPANRLNLGIFSSCSGAVIQAKRSYTQSNGCVHCAPACHTT